jgi:DNA-binding NarL/FixJ family response regulator
LAKQFWRYARWGLAGQAIELPDAKRFGVLHRLGQTLLKIASGKRLSDIAEELMLSPKTVSVYRSRVLEKLKLGNNAELTVYAIRNGLV